jgi:hypothetical protein
MTNHITYHYASNDIVIFNTARVYGETALEPMKRMGYYHLCSGAHIPVVKIISKRVSLLVIYEKVINGTS